MRILAGGFVPHVVAGLAFLSALSVGCVGTTTSSPVASAMLDQRLAAGGFMAPRRAPRPRRPVTIQPSLLAASRGLFFPSLSPGATASAPLTSSPLASFLPQLGGTSGPPPKVQRLPARPGCGYVKVSRAMKVEGIHAYSDLFL